MLRLDHTDVPSVWAKSVSGQIECLSAMDALSARSQLIDFAHSLFARSHPSFETQWPPAILAVFQALVQKTPYVLHEPDALHSLYPFFQLDPLIAYWIECGARVHAPYLLKQFIKRHRLTSIYARLLEQIGVRFQPDSPKDNYLFYSVKHGNVPMAALLLDHCQVPDQVIDICLSAIYTLESSSPSKMLSLFAQQNLVHPVQVPFSMADTFWRRQDDAFKARWLETLYLFGVFSLVPTRFAVLGPLTQQALDNQSLFRRLDLLSLVA